MAFKEAVCDPEAGAHDMRPKIDDLMIKGHPDSSIGGHGVLLRVGLFFPTFRVGLFFFSLGWACLLNKTILGVANFFMQN